MGFKVGFPKLQQWKNPLKVYTLNKFIIKCMLPVSASSNHSAPSSPASQLPASSRLPAASPQTRFQFSNFAYRTQKKHTRTQPRHILKDTWNETQDKGHSPQDTGQLPVPISFTSNFPIPNSSHFQLPASSSHRTALGHQLPATGCQFTSSQCPPLDRGRKVTGHSPQDKRDRHRTQDTGHRKEDTGYRT